MTTENGRGRARPLRWLVGFGVAALSCWLLARDLDWQGVVEALGGADYGWVAAGVLAIIGTFFTRTRRWQALLWQAKARFRPVLAGLLIGQVINLALPMRSGDVVRATWLAAEQDVGLVEALGSVALEKVWELLALLVCGLALLVWMPLPGWFARSTWGTALALGVGTLLLLGALHWQRTLFDWAGRLLARLPAGWDRALLPRLRRLANGLEAIRQPDVSWRALVWTGLTWGLGALANLAVLAAFGVASVPAAFLLMAALRVGGVVPVPGQLGLFEGICVFVLGGFFRVPDARALAAGLVLHLVVVGPPLVAAALLALWPGRGGA